MKKAKSGRKNRSVICKRVARPDLCGVVARDRCSTSDLVEALCERSSCPCCLVRLQTCIPSFNSSPRIRSAPKTPIVLGHLPEEARWFPRRPWACEKRPWTCASRPGGRAPDGSRSRVSGCTIRRACCQVRTSLAKSTRSTRSIFVQAGRFTCRWRMISCWRKRAFSAMSSELLLPKSASVPSRKDDMSGLVQRVKREESASKQFFFSRRRWVSHTSQNNNFSII